MLIVLSEMDCLHYLQDHGVYPDVFYMDLIEMQKRLTVCSDVTLLIMFAGAGGFHKRKISEFITHTQEQIEKEEGVVTKLYVLSDVTLPSVKGYYQYLNAPISAIKKNGYKVVSKSERNILKRIRTDEPKECETHIVEENRPRLVNETTEREDALLALIQVPEFG